MGGEEGEEAVKADPLFVKVNKYRIIPISHIERVEVDYPGKGDLRIWADGEGHFVEYKSTKTFILSLVAGRFPQEKQDGNG